MAFASIQSIDCWNDKAKENEIRYWVNPLNWSIEIGMRMLKYCNLFSQWEWTDYAIPKHNHFTCLYVCDIKLFANNGIEINNNWKQAHSCCLCDSIWRNWMVNIIWKYQPMQNNVWLLKVNKEVSQALPSRAKFSQ